MNTFDVTFRYIGINTNSGEVPCICLSSKRKEDAYSIFSFFHDYMKCVDLTKTFRVEFTRQSNDSYSLTIRINFLAEYFETTVTDISAVHVNKIIDQLRSFLYYIITAGYENTNGFELLPIGTYHLFKQNIYLDGSEIVGKQENSFDWNSFLSEIRKAEEASNS